MAQLPSPFKAASAQSFSETKISGKLVIRVDDTTSTDRIVIRIGGGTAAVDNYNFFLNAGESIEISGIVIPDGSHVSVIATAGNPDICWGVI